VITRQALKAAVTKTIGAAVAGPDAGVMPPVNHEGHDCRPNRIEQFVAGFLLQFLVCGQESCSHRSAKIKCRGDRRNGVEMANHGGAGEIAGSVAAHAVGDGPEADVGAIEDGVLIQLSDAAGMRERDGAEAVWAQVERRR